MAKAKDKDPRVDVLGLIAQPIQSKDKPDFLPDVPEWKDAFPTLNAFFTVTELNGKVRQTPTITIWVEDWGVKAVLADRENKRKLWLTSHALDALWGDLDSLLKDPNARWTDDTGARRKRS